MNTINSIHFAESNLIHYLDRSLKAAPTNTKLQNFLQGQVDHYYHQCCELYPFDQLCMDWKISDLITSIQNPAA